jgi:APA family basic amino acid/polyamine antiporter
MAEKTTGEMIPTLGLTGLTMNAMAMIAPGAFLWLTFAIQGSTGVSAPAMWSGIFAALLLSLATASCYAELSKLYPGTGSSYYFAEQSFLNHDKAWKYARLMKFIVGWGSHLYYWIYTGVMVCVTGVFCGYVVGTLWPNFMSAANPGPMFMMLVAVIFSFGVAYIAFRGVVGATSVNIAINIIQITALLIFSIMAIHYRVGHPAGSVAWQWDATTNDAYQCEFATTSQTVNGTATDVITRDANMVPVCKKDAAGAPVPYHIDYPYQDSSGNFVSHTSAKSVFGIHKVGWMVVQATVAIFLLVGFESCTSLGGEAKNAKRDIPIAVILSLLIQGAFCYLFEYFAANFFLNSGYPMSTATGSAAPIGDMMVVVGDALFGQGHGRTFMLVEAITVFLALIGTTLSCLNTGARVTYAMGKDDEVPEHFGMLHGKNLTPHRSIWILAFVAAVIGVIGCSNLFGDASALADSVVQALPHGFWSSVGYLSHDKMAALPNSLLTVTLISNFGTFMLYGLTCFVCLMAYSGHPNYSFLRHMAIPVFGLLANAGCMIWYAIGPFLGYGTKLEPFTALGVALVWGIYGAIYFVTSSKKKGRTTLVTARTTTM